MPPVSFPKFLFHSSSTVWSAGKDFRLYIYIHFRPPPPPRGLKKPHNMAASWGEVYIKSRLNDFYTGINSECILSSTRHWELLSLSPNSLFPRKQRERAQHRSAGNYLSSGNKWIAATKRLSVNNDLDPREFFFFCLFAYREINPNCGHATEKYVNPM